MELLVRGRHRTMGVGVFAASVLGLFPVLLCPTLEAQASASSPWQMQESGTTASLRGILSVDGKIAWASGTEGTVLRTVDGGVHWAKCAVPPEAETLDFRGVQAYDANTALVMSSGPGDKSRLYKTTDGCKSWKLIFKNPDSPDGFFDSFFADWTPGTEAGTQSWSGSLLGDPVKGTFMIFDTPDSGVTWVARKNADLALNGPGQTGVDLAAFAASNSLFPANQNGAHVTHIFASGGKSGATVWIEKTPGIAVGMASASSITLSHWTRVKLPLAGGNESSGIFSIARREESVPVRDRIAVEETLMAVGGDYQKPNESSGTAAWSTDRVHWTASTKPPHGYRSGVTWSPDQNGWIAVGTNGSDISSEDGTTWTPLDNGNWNAISYPFVVGPKGRIGRFSDSAR
jgi:photosystem II stability/assembly factor-like uncharacterized protein